MERGEFPLQRGRLCTRESPRVGRLQEMMATNKRGGGKQHETYLCFLLRASFQERNTSFSFVAVFGWFNVFHFGSVAETSDEQIKNFPPCLHTICSLRESFLLA